MIFQWYDSLKGVLGWIGISCFVKKSFKKKIIMTNKSYGYGLKLAHLK